MNPEYTTKIVKPEELSQCQLTTMADLYLSHYDATCHETFFADLKNKTEVLLVIEGSRLVGFTTIENFLWQDNDKTINVVYSGDTIVNPLDWGQQVLAFTWVKYMGDIQRKNPLLPMYWLLIVKGHRTFKYLPALGKKFYPHWNGDDKELAALASRLADFKFGKDYNPESGVVEFKKSRGQLKPEIAKPSDAQLQKDSVRFFLEKNPGYLKGHELVCLCPFEEDNLRPLALRLFRKASP